MGSYAFTRGRSRVRSTHRPSGNTRNLTLGVGAEGTKKAPSTPTVLLISTAALLILMLGWTSAGNAEAATPTLNRCALLHDTLPRRACIIRSVFRSEGAKAVAVARCESGLDPEARNGQYRGVFQMGAAERARYGHGRTVLAQARAAKRYHAVSGWSPWSCA